MKFRSILALVAAAGALSVGTGSALAQGEKAGPQAGAMKAAAAYIGVSVSELRTQLRAGNSLANVAAAHGKSIDGLKAAIVAAAKSHLDQAVAAGKLTADRAAQILAKAKSTVAQLVMRTGAPAHKGKGKAKGAAAYRGAVKSAATYLGLTLAELRTQLQSGKSLAQEAAAQGKSVDGLKAAIVADAKAVIDKLVAAGKITAERGAQYLQQIQAHLDGLVNRTRTAK